MTLYVILFFVLLLLELLYFRVADRYNIIDKPNQRSSHTRITLRGGGIIFYFGALLYLIVSGGNYPFFMLGLTMITIISFIDDIGSVSRKLRLIVQFTAMLLMFYQWGLFSSFPLWYLLVALICCTGIINAYNFMDGVNGITGGYSLIALLSLLYLNEEVVFFTNSSFILIMILSVLVFNIFNFRTNAKCFAGDVGAVTIAFVILFLMGQLILKTGDLSYIILLAVYGVDSVFTIIHRLRLRENIFDAHRKHAYQLLANELKWKHTIVSSLYMAVQLVINIGFICVGASNHWMYLLITLIVLGLIYILFIKRYFKLHQA